MFCLRSLRCPAYSHRTLHLHFIPVAALRQVSGIHLKHTSQQDALHFAHHPISTSASSSSSYVLPSSAYSVALLLLQHDDRSLRCDCAIIRSARYATLKMPLSLLMRCYFQRTCFVRAKRIYYDPENIKTLRSHGFFFQNDPYKLEGKNSFLFVVVVVFWHGVVWVRWICFIWRV